MHFRAISENTSEPVLVHCRFVLFEIVSVTVHCWFVLSVKVYKRPRRIIPKIETVHKYKCESNKYTVSEKGNLLLTCFDKWTVLKCTAIYALLHQSVSLKQNGDDGHLQYGSQGVENVILFHNDLYNLIGRNDLYHLSLSIKTTICQLPIMF